MGDRKRTHGDKPLVFLDVSIASGPAEKMVFELFYDLVPKTADNFRALCTGEKGVGPITGKRLHYKGCKFHRIGKDFMEGGDFSNGDGSGGESIYGRPFKDESLSLKHDGAGYLSMSNTGPNRNGSQFFITFKSAYHLDGRFVVFGKLVEGRNVLEKIAHEGSEQGEPKCLVEIVDCGEYEEAKEKSSNSKSSGGRRKKKRGSTASESESSIDSDSNSAESDSDSDSSSSSSSNISSSSDDRRRKRKRSYKREKYKRSNRRDKRCEKRRRRRDKRSKCKSRRLTYTR